MNAKKTWRGRVKSILAAATVGLLAVGGVALAPATANAAPNTTLALTATPSEGSLSITADVADIPEESPGVYVTLIEKGTLAEVSDVNPYAKLIRKAEFVDQAGSATLTVPAADLDPSKDYEVIAWPHMSFPSEANLYASADLVLTEADWDILVPAPAPAPTTLALTATPSEGSLSITADVADIPEESPGVYVTLIEKGDLASVAESNPYAKLIRKAEFVDQTGSETLTVPAADLDPSKDYEVIAWPHMSFPSEANLYASADLVLSEADWDILVPAEEVAPSLTIGATEVANERVDFTFEGRGFHDIPQVGPSVHVYLGLIEEGADLSEIEQTTDMLSVAVDVLEDGTFGPEQLWENNVFSIDADKLDRTKNYQVISWPARSNPTPENLYATADVEIDWDALFPEEQPVVDPQLTVTPSTDVDPAGQTVTVTGEGYNPNQAIYVFLCGDIELPTDLWTHALGCRDGAVVVYENGAVDNNDNPRANQFSEDGSFEVEFDVKQLNEGATAVFTAANHTGMQNREQDAKTVLEFAEPAPVYNPELTVTPNTDLDPAGATVTVSGEGYNPNQAIYVTPCADIPLEDVDFQFINSGCTSGAILVWNHGANRGVEFDENGSFEATMTVTPRANADVTALYTIANHTAQNDRGQDAKAALGFAPAHETTTTVVSPTVNAAYGDEVELVASVTPANATGTVTFFADGEQLGESQTRITGDVTLRTSDLPAGENQVTAVFTPANANSFEESTSSALTVDVAKASTSTSVEVAPTAPAYGDELTLTATVAPAAAGSVEFFNGTDSIDTATVEAGVAEISLSDLDAGDHEITAVFSSSDDNYEGSTSEAVTVTVAKAQTSVELNAPATVERGTTTQLTASVAPAVPGTVAFFSDDEQIGEPVEVENGVASIETGELENEEYAFSAVFTPADGDNYEGSDAEQSVQTLDHSAAQITIDGEKPGEVTAGTRVVLQAGPFAEGTKVSATVHSDPIELGTKTVDANGSVSFAWSVPADFRGDHQIVFTTDGGTEVSADFTVVAGAPSNNGDDNQGDDATTVSNTGNGDQGNKSALAATGADSLAGMAAASLLVLLVGTGLLLAARRKQALQD
ncbi:Ig-like domain repeat protein [Leucobacter sp. GX24907]